MVVQHYIQTTIPVSSAYIAEEYEQDISSATIRNILAELEDDGYLTHPHTSAGRVPTERGYRYYVDFLMQQIELVEEERLRLQKEYQRGVEELEALVEKTTQVIAELTHCTSIVMVDGWSHQYVCRGTNYLAEAVGAQSLQRMVAILKELEEKDKILAVLRRDLDRKIKIYIGQETDCVAFEDCAMAVARFQTRRGPSGRIAVLGPSRMDYRKVISSLEYVAELMHEAM
jgi:transcriptional regulator of heat shock response